MIIRGYPTMIEILMAAEPTMVLPKIAEWTIMCYSTVAQHHRAVDQVAERADIMQDHEDAGACRQPPCQDIGKHSLMLEVNSRGGLVQDQEVGVAGKCPGDQHPLLLAAGQRSDVGVELFGESNLRDSVMDRLAVASAQRSKGPPVRQSSGCDDLFHLRPAEQRKRALRNVANARPLPEGPQWQAEKAHRAAFVGQQAEQGPDQRGFSGAVASHQSQSLARLYREADPAQHGKAAQFDNQIVGLEHRTRSYEHPPAFRSAARFASMTEK
jgi:hypothetical protein